MISSRIRHRPASPGVVTQEPLAGLPFFGYTSTQAVNEGGDVDEYGAVYTDRRMPQLASIPKAKRQAALRPTRNGSDEDSNERNSGQRVGGRSHNSEDAPVQIRLTRLSSLAVFKRLIPYSKQVQRGSPARAGRDFAMPELNAFPQYPDCMFCADRGITVDTFNGFRWCGCAVGVARRLTEPEVVNQANQARIKVGA